MISVVIPAYNSSITIKDCVESVLNQSRADLIEEIIVVNDGSTDDTVSIVEELQLEMLELKRRNQNGLHCLIPMMYGFQRR